MRRVTRLATILLIGAASVVGAQQTPSEIDRAVEEFKIQTQDLGLRADSPSHGRRAQKGGFDRWHGRLFWNFRNDRFDAVPHEVTQTSGDQGILRRNQIGFNVSGPLILPKLYHGGNRTFLSVSYEGMRETVGRSSLHTIPTTPERTGDFSATVDSAGKMLPIYDPATTHPNPNYDPSQPVSITNLEYLRDPFPGNRIPEERLDPVALSALSYYPAPNVNIGPYFTNNYSVYAPEQNSADGMRTKLDHSIGNRHRFSAGFNFSNGFSGPASFFPNIADPGRPDRDFRSRGAQFQHTFTISPNIINTLDVRATTSTSENKVGVSDTGETFPVYHFEPYLSMGRGFPVSRTARTELQIEDGFSTRIGTHSLSISAELNREQANSFWPQYPSGRFDFSEGLTSLPGIVNTGHSFGSFMLGLAEYAEGSIVNEPSYFRRTRARIGFEDEWELRQNLTLSFGANIEMAAPRVEKYDRQSTVDLELANPENGLPGALVFANRDGAGRGFQNFQVRAEPRVSLAWNPFDGNQTVLRLSYRRNYTPIPLRSGQWGTQGFTGTPTYLSGNPQQVPALVLSDGLPPPAHAIPDLRPEAANDTIADLADATGLVPTYDFARFSLERQLPGSLVMTVGLNYTRGRHMLADNDGVNPNAVPLDDLRFRDRLNDEDFNRSLRPYPQYRRFDVSQIYPAGSYERSEGFVRLETRTSQGLSLRMVYEYSKQMDDYESRGGLQDYYHPDKEWSLNPWNNPHTVSLSYMYELPFGPNKQFLNASDWRGYVLGGWAISGITTYSSGNPIQLRAQFNNSGNVLDPLYVNAVPDVDPMVANPGPDGWFNAAAFINPPDFTIGNVARAHPVLRNPSRQNHDLSVTKRLNITSERSLEFMGTAFNFLNHANWNRPDAIIGTAGSPNTNAGKITGSRGGRVIQLGLRLTF